jgi:hypothetical protein
MEKTQRPRRVLVSDDEDETTAKRRFLAESGVVEAERKTSGVSVVFDGQHILVCIRMQYISVLRELLDVFNNIGKFDVEFVVERVQPKCRVSGSPGSIWAGGERSALSLLHSGDFWMSFSFLAYCTASNKM